jgi:hypothetical protein
MGQKSDQIERQIDLRRGELGENLHELQAKVEQVTDWRAHFQKRPMVIIGAAFGGGLLLASMTGRRSRGRRHYREDTALSQPSGHTRATELQKSKALETFDSIKGALIGVAANTFKDLLGEVIPGFRQQLDETTRAKATGPSSSTSARSAYSSSSSG